MKFKFVTHQSDIKKSHFHLPNFFPKNSITQIARCQSNYTSLSSSSSSFTVIHHFKMTFPTLHIIDPQPGHAHTHTLILLHGRGSTGHEFAEDLLESPLSSGQTLQTRLPTWRLVFPSSKELYSSTFQEDFPQWFDIASLTDPASRPELQIPGLSESVEYIRSLVASEVELLGENSEQKLFLGGISMGFATGMWAFLTFGQRLGGFVGASGWLPFAREIEGSLGQRKEGNISNAEIPGEEVGPAFVRDMMAATECGLRGGVSTLQHTPVFLGHGTDDELVDCSLGVQARDVLRNIGFRVDWREYCGAEQEGHWLKEPEEVDDIVRFLEVNSGVKGE